MKLPSYMGEHLGCRETAVRFGISGSNVNPHEITRLFGVNPTKAFAKGDRYQSKSGSRIRDFGHWSVDSKDLIKSTSTEKHALAVLKVLEPGNQAIQAYAGTGKARVVVSVWWDGADYTGGFTLRSQTMKQLADLCNEIDFHFVCSAPEAQLDDSPQ